MSRFLITRIVAVSVAILFAALALALWRAQYDVQREERGAAEMVRLFEHLYALENGPPGEIPAELEALRRINESGHLRHVQLAVRDDAGTLRVAPRDLAPSTWLEKLFARVAPGVGVAQTDPSGPWTLQRDDGTRFVATLSLNPASEQQEALDNLVGMLIVLVGYGIALLLAVYWALHRALKPLQPLLGAIGRYENNDFVHRLPTLPFAEMDRIGRALNHLAATLARAQEERRVLSLKLVSSQEEERAKIARELHDEFGQTLTAMRADVAWLSHRTAGSDELHAVVRELAEHCERFHVQVRDLLRRLRPQAANTGAAGIPLQRLLGDLVQSWRDRPGQRTQFSLECELGAREIPEELALALYRLTQEALTNAARHADATNVSVRVVANGGGDIEWCAEDDGIGLDSVESAAHRGNGLAGMRERVWAHGGEIEMSARSVEAKPRAGLRIRARFAAALAPKI
ncbi:MAG: histidine kinase [Rhodanobacteraceae bacterium]